MTPSRANRNNYIFKCIWLILFFLFTFHSNKALGMPVFHLKLNCSLKAGHQGIMDEESRTHFREASLHSAAPRHAPPFSGLHLCMPGAFITGPPGSVFPSWVTVVHPQIHFTCSKPDGSAEISGWSSWQNILRLSLLTISETFHRASLFMDLLVQNSTSKKDANRERTIFKSKVQR